MNIKHLISFILLIGSTISQAQFTDVINSNRPGESQSAFSVGKRVFQIETGLNGFHENHSLQETDSKGFFYDMNVRWGVLAEELEFNAKIQYQIDNYSSKSINETRNGFRKSSFGFKLLVYDPYKNYKEKINIHSWKANQKFKWRRLVPAVAVYGGFNSNARYPHSYNIDQKLSPKLALITQNQFSGNYVLVLNLIGDNITSTTPTYTYILTLTKGFSVKWSGFIENQGIKSDYYSDVILRGGVAYLANKNLQFDASVSTNFKDTPSLLYGGIGLSWRNAKKHKPVILKGKKKIVKKTKPKDKNEIIINQQNITTQKTDTTTVKTTKTP